MKKITITLSSEVEEKLKKYWEYRNGISDFNLSEEELAYALLVMGLESRMSKFNL